MATLTKVTIGSVDVVDTSGNIDPLNMVGMIHPFTMATPPTGWIICEGQSLNSSTNTQYARLFSAIGTSWGGSGATAFSLPDLRGRFLRSWANGSANDPDRASRTGGDNVGSSQTGGMRQYYTHCKGSRDGGPDANLQLNQGSPYLSDPTYGSMTVSHFNGYRHTHQTGAWNYHTMPMWNRIAGGSDHRPINMYVMYCIKY